MPSYPPRDDSMIPFITRALRNGREKEYHAMGTFKISTEEEALADNVFVAFNTRRRREQLVVKLMDDDLEMDFMNYMNRRDIPELFNHVVEWKDWGAITFPNNIGQCIGLVLEAGTATLENRLRESVMKEDEYAKYSCVAHLINGVKMLHAQNIIHGNISLDNILYFGDKGHFKFIDFAVATLINQPMQSMCTPEYCPPEMAKHLLNPTPEGIPAKAEYDIWCLAVVILKMFMPNFTLVEFVHKSDRAVLEMIASDDFSFKKSFEACTLSTPQRDDLAKCLNLDPTLRASLQSLWSLLPRKTTMDANIRRVERQLMASQKTQVQLDKYKVPCLWTLEDTNPNPSGFIARGKRLLMRKFRIVFLCELRDEKPCEHYDDDAPILEANSDLMKQILPVLKASCLVVKALGLVVGWGGIIGDYFNFDMSKYTTLETVMDAVSSINDVADRLDLEEKLSSVVEKLEEERDEISEEEVQSLMDDIKDAFVKFRDDPATYQKLLNLLESAKFDWQKKVTIGGLEKKVVRIDDVKNNPDATGDASEAGEVRWVCKAHAETFKNRFI